MLEPSDDPGASMADTQSFLDWLRELFFDDDKRAAFEADPRQVLQQAGFDDVSPAELREGLALVGSEPGANPALLEQTLAATAGAHQAASPAQQAATAEPPPPPPAGETRTEAAGAPPPSVPGSVGPGTVSPGGPQGGVDPLADLGMAATALTEDARRDASIAEEAGTREAPTPEAGDDLAGIGLLDDAGARLDDLGIGSAEAQPPFAEAGGGEEPIGGLDIGTEPPGGLAPDPFAFTPTDPLAAEPTDPFAVAPADPFAPEPAPLDDPFGLAQADPFAVEGLDDAGSIWDASDEVAGPAWDDPADPFDDPSPF